MGVIVVDICLMYRDATIKRSPVRPVPICLCSSVTPVLPELFVLIFCILSPHRDGHQRRTRYGFVYHFFFFSSKTTFIFSKMWTERLCYPDLKHQGAVAHCTMVQQRTRRTLRTRAFVCNLGFTQSLFLLWFHSEPFFFFLLCILFSGLSFAVTKSVTILHSDQNRNNNID